MKWTRVVVHSGIICLCLWEITDSLALLQPRSHQRRGYLEPQAQQDVSMLHPLMIAIVVVNTSMTIGFWTFLLSEVFFKEAETEEAKATSAVTPA